MPVLNESQVREIIDNEWLGLGDTSKLNLVSPFDRRNAQDVENPLLHLFKVMRELDYFGFTCKHLFNKTVPPYQLAILKELWTRPFPMLIASRGAGKSFLLALYSMLRATLCQGVKIVIVGAAFRQAKVVFEYCEEIWNNAPILREICGDSHKNGPRRDVDRCTLRINDSMIIALPLGTGEKIRGQRANVLVAEEFASLPNEIFENVVSGFAAVSMDPIEKLKNIARKRAMKRLGLILPNSEEELAVPGLNSNQTIISGTAYYAFNHFCNYWKKWKAIIESKGDRHKLEEIFNGEVPDKFSWKDYSVIRLPVGMLPEGFMDEKHVSKAKATIHHNQYQMEYGACGRGDTPVIVADGVKPLSEVRPGDLVLTHKGRFRKVLKNTFRKWSAGLFELKTSRVNRPIYFTSDHPFWDGDGWTTLGSLEGQTTLAALQETFGKQELDVREVVDDYLECFDTTIYPRPSQSKFTREQLCYIRSSRDTQSAIAKRYGVNQGAIHSVINKRCRPKNAIHSTIPLDYDFGLVVGYYAAEGSVGANGRAVSFALDGHVGTRLESYVTQLRNACELVFGFAPKVYMKDSVANITINQRLAVDLMKWVCPGVSHTKTIRPEILYSNPEFMRGFIIGYWNGNGHLPVNTDASPIATCVNKGLMSQIRVALSYFGIVASIYDNPENKTAKFRGKTYPCKQSFSIVLHGDNERRFRELFYGETGTVSTPEPVDKFKLEIKSKELVPFEGLVYNLEVEEDNSYSLLNATVHNCFPSDSNGFYKRSLVESCVVGKPDRPIHHTSCGEVSFNAVLRGDPNKSYVIAIDPASENDNFSAVVLELCEDHRRIVHCWTTTRKRHKAKLAKGLVKEDDFYSYTARKIRDLIALFPCVKLALDMQGGGVAVMEALCDPQRCRPGERPIYPVVDPEKPRETDNKPGDHILEMVQFARAEWVAEANHGMRKDFEDKVLLFPEFDPAVVGLAIEEDKATGRVKANPEGDEKLYDTLEDCVMEIEELKDELATIVHSQTGTSMRDRWDTPEVKMAGGKKGRLRKDRYSALLMANMVGRSFQRVPTRAEYAYMGGFAHDLIRDKEKSPEARRPTWQNPDWYTLSAGFGAAVRRCIS